MYWMITKCRRETIDRRIRDTCENPSTEGSFESVFPIPGLRTGDYYRNRYCVICDGIDPALIEDTHWTVDISCDTFISISSDNLLQTFKRENCRIVFQSPNQENRIYDNDCYIPPYKISKCNVTKKWPRYDKDVDLACRSYIDPLFPLIKITIAMFAMSRHQNRQKTGTVLKLQGLYQSRIISRSAWIFGWLVVLRLNVPVNNFSVISGRSHRFLGN